MQIVTKETFASSVLESESPVLVDFFAPWCQPCKALDPILARLESEGVKVAKVDVDASQELANAYSVRSLPTLILFSEGNPVATSVGMATEAKIREILK